MQKLTTPDRLLWAALCSGILLWVGCSKNFITPATGTSRPVDTRLFGEWRNESLHVEHQTYRGKDLNYVLDVPAGQWEEKMKIQPIRTNFRPDGNYTSEYRTLSDSLFLRREGTWTATGKRLTMRERFPDKKEYVNEYTIDGNRATFKSTLDFDGDGKSDDQYSGVQRKQ